jgi:Protein of unknown function (DUF3891)
MLHREDADGLVVVAQRAHEWLAGQLARAWGNARFGAVEPWEEVCLAAEQHGLAWLAWEQAPTLNPATGRPYALFELPLAELLAVLAPAPRWTLTQARYPALLVSLHFSGIAARWRRERQGTPEADLLGDFLERQRPFEEELVASLRSDPYYAPHATPERLGRNRRLVLAWDRISLALCGGLRAPRGIVDVPTADGETAIDLTPVGGDPTRVAVAPWPFRERAVTVVCEGRRLPDRYADEAAMRAALAAAPWRTILTHLSPG